MQVVQVLLGVQIPMRLNVGVAAYPFPAFPMHASKLLTIAAVTCNSHILARRAAR